MKAARVASRTVIKNNFSISHCILKIVIRIENYSIEILLHFICQDIKDRPRQRPALVT